MYIGETGRPLKMRIAEHVRAVTNGDVQNANTVQEDVMNHKINWRGAEVIDREMAVKERRIKESIHIYIRRNRTYNLDSGYPLSPVWDSLIGHL